MPEAQLTVANSPGCYCCVLTGGHWQIVPVAGTSVMHLREEFCWGSTFGVYLLQLRHAVGTTVQLVPLLAEDVSKTCVTLVTSLQHGRQPKWLVSLQDASHMGVCCRFEDTGHARTHACRSVESVRPTQSCWICPKTRKALLLPDWAKHPFKKRAMRTYSVSSHHMQFKQRNSGVRLTRSGRSLEDQRYMQVLSGRPLKSSACRHSFPGTCQSPASFTVTRSNCST